jgi:hypothetical protein
LPYSELKVICPYTNLQYATEFFLRLEEPKTRFVYTGHSTTAYYELLKELWNQQETFIMVEHDIVIWPGALHDLWECSEPLCAYEAPYNITLVGGRRGLSYGIGCLKWNSILMTKFPNLVIDTPEEDREWVRLDQVFVVKAAIANNDCIHYHYPPIGHLNRARFPMDHLISEETE